MPTDQEFKCSDGKRIVGSVFAAQTARARLIIAPAMGVPQGFYRRLAAWLAAHDIEAITFDYRNTPGTQMADWGRFDIDAAIRAASDSLPLFLLGHSCGGQLAGLAPSAQRLDGIIFVAAQSGYWGHWSGVGRAGMWFLSHAVIPALSRGAYFPARKLGICPIDVPSSVVKQWARWMRSPRYLFDAGNRPDTEAYRRLAVPAIVCGSRHDRYAPAAAIDALQGEYPRLRVDHRWQFTRADHGGKAIGHMDFFRACMQASLWQPMADWLVDAADGPSARDANQIDGGPPAREPTLWETPI